MNYYNPYFYTIPTMPSAPKVGLLSRLFGSRNITFGGIIDGTQKVLNIANQAIPLVRQVKPLVGNAKTMFKVMNEFNRIKNVNKQSSNFNTNNMSNINNNTNNGGPTFFA